MDVLSDLLRVIRLNAAVLFRVTLGSPWSFVTPPGEAFLQQLPPSIGRLSVFHIVIRGQCMARLQPGGATLKLTEGEGVILPRCDPLLLTDRMDLEPVSAAVLMGDCPLTQLRDVSDGSGRVDTEILCGFLSSEQTMLEPLLASLPPIFRISLSSTGDKPGMAHLLDHAVGEVTSNDTGAADARLRITELLFVESLRRYTQSLADDETGWLSGLRDPVVGKAIQLMHDEPYHGWTVAELASRAAVSRSLLATRFKALMDEPPMRYLAHWRLLLATRQLHDNRLSIPAIAEHVGYDSPEAFQRAYKKYYGETPAACRKRVNG